ncbi:23S rRNA (guanosine(2251)-2'-O)-methyltransferase RlmB [Saccharicrinis sp. FJH54]|uniref:23S rRNA (guanosine(2251)-2'-O)-methyltransferase RlmB n=1 Tax=Saccharicrinis sp. FJH54 TaxID=3344665 RepID=UPI0035D47C10
MANPDYIFGIRAVIEAIDAGKEIHRIMVKRDLKGDLATELFNALKGRSVPLQKVPVERLNRITRKNHQGVVAWISEVVYHDIETIIPGLYEAGKTPFILVLDGVTDVRNFGAIARTAECAGVDAILVPSKGSAVINADAIKTSAGALHKIPVCRTTNLLKSLQFLKGSGLKLLGASEKGDTVFNATQMDVPLAIVMGSEDTGLSAETLRICDYLVSIPMQGTVSSLNVSVAAGILIFEVVKQRMPAQMNR